KGLSPAASSRGHANDVGVRQRIRVGGALRAALRAPHPYALYYTTSSDAAGGGANRADTVCSAMQQRFVVLDDWTNFWRGQPAVDRLRQRGEVVIHTTPAGSEDEVIKRLENATVVLANRERTLLPARVLRSAERLELL